MSVLCQIILVDDDKKFMDHLKQFGYPESVSGGWGRFTSEVPVIGTTLQINWSDTEEFLGPESDYFRVIYHHLHLIPKSNFKDPKNLQLGHYSVDCCMVYVVRVDVRVDAEKGKYSTFSN